MNGNAFVSLVNLLKRKFEENAAISKDNMASPVQSLVEHRYELGKMHAYNTALDMLRETVKAVVTAEDADDIISE